MIEQIKTWLNYSLFTFNERAFTVLEVLAVPVGLVLSIWFAKFLIGSFANRLKAKKKDPNIVHLIERILYVIALAVIFSVILGSGSLHIINKKVKREALIKVQKGLPSLEVFTKKMTTE